MARGSPEEYNRPGTSMVEQGAWAGGVFVGRESELSQLCAALDEAWSGHGSLMMLAGEPGIGKSRLAEELAVRARERGFLVLWGRCWEAGGAPAYWPWVQALRAHITTTDPGDLIEQLGGAAGHLAQMIPDIQASLPDVDAPDVDDPDAARFQLFDAATSFLLAVSAHQPILLVLDDLHVADTPSLLLLRFASGEVARGRVLMVGSFREPDPDRDGPLPPQLVDLVYQPSSRFLSLAGLSEPDVSRFIERSTGIAPPTSLASTVCEETEGNPLFIREWIRLLAQEGRFASIAAGAPPTLPAGVRELIGRRLGSSRTSEAPRTTMGPWRRRPRATFRREGEYWSIAFDGDTFRLKDSMGLRHLSMLLATPGREIHSLELVAAVRGQAPQDGHRDAELDTGTGDAGEILDVRAKTEYRYRLNELESELAEAESWNDPERASRLREEVDFLVRELRAAIGLGGRDRRAASNAERARVSVTKAIKAALERIAEHSPSLGRHFHATIRTGTFCTYEPDPRVPVVWSS
jgi:AAA ATPase domain